MSQIDQGGRGWHKSSYSGTSGECVEVGEAVAGPAAVAVRDTKALGAGPVLGFTAEAWSAFVAEIKGGGFAA